MPPSSTTLPLTPAHISLPYSYAPATLPPSLGPQSHQPFAHPSRSTTTTTSAAPTTLQLKMRPIISRPSPTHAKQGGGTPRGGAERGPPHLSLLSPRTSMSASGGRAGVSCDAARVGLARTVYARRIWPHAICMVISLLDILYVHRIYVCIYGFGQPYARVLLLLPTFFCFARRLVQEGIKWENRRLLFFFCMNTKTRHGSID